jgi:hypothetical protein
LQVLSMSLVCDAVAATSATSSNARRVLASTLLTIPIAILRLEVQPQGYGVGRCKYVR